MNRSAIYYMGYRRGPALPSGPSSLGCLGGVEACRVTVSTTVTRVQRPARTLASCKTLASKKEVQAVRRSRDLLLTAKAAVFALREVATLELQPVQNFRLQKAAARRV